MLAVKVLQRASVAAVESSHVPEKIRRQHRKLCSGYCRRPPAVYENKALIEYCDFKFPDKRSQHHVIKHKSKKFKRIRITLASEFLLNGYIQRSP